MSHDCCVALPRGAMGLSAVCDGDISWSYSLTFFTVHLKLIGNTHENLEKRVTDKQTFIFWSFPFGRKIANDVFHLPLSQHDFNACKTKLYHDQSWSPYAFLAQQIRIYRRFYPGSVSIILLMLSYPGCHERTVHWLYIVVKWRHCSVKMTSSCNNASQCILGLLETSFEINTQRWARKRIHYLYEGGIEKYVPRAHRLSSLDKPRDANWCISIPP